MMKHSIMTILLAALLLTAGTMPVYAEETQPATMPVPADYELPQETVDIYGFSADLTELTLSEGEIYPLKITLDEQYYYPESVVFDSDHDASAAVSRDGIITAREPGTANIRISAKLNEAYVTNFDKDTNVRTITVKVTVTYAKTLTAEQTDALNQLKRKGNRLFGEFQREEKVIRGEYPADAPRLDMDTVERIKASSFGDICKEISKLQPYPDYIGGSGVQLTEYWFDDTGKEKLLLISPQDEIWYVRCSEDGSVAEYCAIYPAETVVTMSDTLLLGSYMVYNDIQEMLMGDVNGDGVFDIGDLIRFQKWLLAVPDTHLTNWTAADFCKDGTLDIYDMGMMKSAMVGNLPETEKQLTLHDVRELSKKGDTLTWADFEPYQHTDVGSGLSVYKYDLEDGYTLLVGGVPGQKPVYIRLSKGERNVDLRDGADAVEAFLAG